MLVLLRWLLIVLLIYFIFKFLGRIFFPILFKKMVKKAEQRMRNQQQKQYQNSTDSEIGETIVEKKPPKSKNDKKVFRVSPSRFALFFLVLSLFLGFGITLYDVYKIERHLLLVEDYTVENKYLKEEVLNSDVEFVFTEYNLYFGGAYYENDVVVICITIDAPDDLVNYLESHNRPFVYVNFNYSELLILYQIVVRNSKDMEDVFGVAIDEKNNKVVIYASNLDGIINVYQKYIDEKILEVKESDSLVER